MGDWRDNGRTATIFPRVRERAVLLISIMARSASESLKASVVPQPNDR